MAINFWDFLSNTLNPSKIKDPVLKQIVDSGRSVNYYKPDWIEPEEMEEDYKKWKNNIKSVYDNKNVEKFPSEFQFRNITDPYLVKGKKQAEAYVTPLWDITPGEDEDPTVAFNNSRPVTNNTIDHELFHALDKGDSYWKDWNRLTARGFQSPNEWASSMARQAKPYEDIGVTRDNQLAKSYIDAYRTRPELGLEELGAYLSTNNPDVKPKWMSNRDYQIIRNFISQRMGW